MSINRERFDDNVTPCRCFNLKPYIYVMLKNVKALVPL